MASSPYSYTSPSSFFRDVCQPVQQKADDPSAQAKPAVVREPLNRDGQQLLRSLPPALRLSYTAARYPHIVNRLAILWNDSRELSRYIDGLLVDDRANRQGFEFETLNELADVRNIRVAAMQRMERGGLR